MSCYVCWETRSILRSYIFESNRRGYDLCECCHYFVSLCNTIYYIGIVFYRNWLRVICYRSEFVAIVRSESNNCSVTTSNVSIFNHCITVAICRSCDSKRFESECYVYSLVFTNISDCIFAIFCRESITINFYTFDTGLATNSTIDCEYVIVTIHYRIGMCRSVGNNFITIFETYESNLE